MATTTRSAKVTLPTDTQILIEREFDAPRDLVWKAYTTPELIKRWWNARRGEVTVADLQDAADTFADLADDDVMRRAWG